MKELVVLTRKDCPYCASVRDNIKKVLQENPGFSHIAVTVMDEDDPRAENLDHYYAPAFFAGDVRISEGNGGAEAVFSAFETVMKS